MLKIENKKIIEIVQNHILSSKSEKRNMKLLLKMDNEVTIFQVTWYL